MRQSLSQAAAHHEIALVEDDCEFSGGGPCSSHLAYYESDFLNFLAKYPFGPVDVNGTDYEQRGLFVFHEPFGSKKYVLSQLDGVPDPDAEYYLSVVR